jgi:hypothetical protein
MIQENPALQKIVDECLETPQLTAKKIALRTPLPGVTTGDFQQQHQASLSFPVSRPETNLSASIMQF